MKKPDPPFFAINQKANFYAGAKKNCFQKQTRNQKEAKLGLESETERRRIPQFNLRNERSGIPLKNNNGSQLWLTEGN